MSRAWYNPEEYPYMYAGTYVNQGHTAAVRKDCDQGGSPCTWQAVCDCGWEGEQHDQYFGGKLEEATLDMLTHAGYDNSIEAGKLNQQTAAMTRRITELSNAARAATLRHEALTRIINGEDNTTERDLRHRRDSHSAWVREDDERDTPPVWQAECACGWKGTTLVPVGCKRTERVQEGTFGDAGREMLAHTGWERTREQTWIDEENKERFTEISQLGEQARTLIEKHEWYTRVSKDTTH